MKNLGFLSAIALLLLGWASAQDEPIDPFEKKPAKQDPAHKDNQAGAAEHSIVLLAEFVEAPKEKTQALLRRTSDTGEQWAAMEKWIASGEARVLDSLFAITRTGWRVRVDGIHELYYPTRRVENPAAPDAPLFPKAFDMMRPGVVLEADPTFDADGKKLNVSLSITRSEFSVGNDHPDLADSGEIQKGDFIEAELERQHLNMRVKGLAESERHFLGSLEPIDPARRDGFSVLAFVRWGKSRSVPPAEGVAPPPATPLKFRAEWIEVSAETWHELSLRNSPSLLADQSWKTAHEWLRTKRATLLHALNFDCLSGQRIRMEVGKQIRHYMVFIPPSVPGGASTPTNGEFRKLGALLEIDPQVEPSGLVQVNMSAEIATHRSDMVYYRRQKEQEWVPTVQMPLVFTNRSVGGFFMGPSSSVLVAVCTPHAEEIGKFDISRKILLFVHYHPSAPTSSEK